MDAAQQGGGSVADASGLLERLLDTLYTLTSKPFVDAGSRWYWLYFASAVAMAAVVYVRTTSAPLGVGGFVRFLLPKQVLLSPIGAGRLRLRRDHGAGLGRYRDEALRPPGRAARKLDRRRAASGHRLDLGPRERIDRHPDSLHRVPAGRGRLPARFAVHRSFHRSSVLWEFHKVHHSAEVLTPITLSRVHPVEKLVEQLASLLVLGVVTGGFLLLFPAGLTIVSILGVNAGRFVFDLAESPPAPFSHLAALWICARAHLLDQPGAASRSTTAATHATSTAISDPSSRSGTGSSAASTSAAARSRSSTASARRAERAPDERGPALRRALLRDRSTHAKRPALARPTSRLSVATQESSRPAELVRLCTRRGEDAPRRRATTTPIRGVGHCGATAGSRQERDRRPGVAPRAGVPGTVWRSRGAASSFARTVGAVDQLDRMHRLRAHAARRHAGASCIRQPGLPVATRSGSAAASESSLRRAPRATSRAA